MKMSEYYNDDEEEDEEMANQVSFPYPPPPQKVPKINMLSGASYTRYIDMCISFSHLLNREKELKLKEVFFSRKKMLNNLKHFFLDKIYF